VSFEEHRALCPDFPVFTLAGLESTQRDTYIRSFPVEHTDRYDPEKLIDQLDRTHQMRPLDTNSLLLSVICFVVYDPHGVTLPARRGELYDMAVEKILSRPRRVQVTYPSGKSDLPLIRKRRVLERAALILFTGMDKQRKLTFDEGSLVDALTKGAEAEGYQADPAPVADALLADLTQNSGILRASAEQGYFFLHLTVQEFLVASGIARVVNDKGWKAQIEVGGKNVTVHKLVDGKAWDPHWQEVIILLAGQLRAPAPLLSLLADQKKDDFFLHRLCLAAMCLPEVSLEIAAHLLLLNLTRRIAGDVINLWLEHNTRSSSFPHVARCFEAITQGNPSTVLPVVLQRLRDPSGEVRHWAAIALGRLGAAAASHPQVIPALRRVLYDPDKDVRPWATDALERMRKAAAQRPEVTPAPVRTLFLPIGLGWHDDTRSMAAGAARWLRWKTWKGKAAAHNPEGMPILVAALLDPDKDVRLCAAIELGHVKEASAHYPEMIPVLIGALRGPDKDVRHDAAVALNRMMASGVRIFKGRFGRWTWRSVEELAHL
jgi:HEAT repeat protein